MILQRKQIQQFSMPARFDQLESLGETVDKFLQKARGLPEPEADRYGIKLAIHELITNVIDHAYDGRDDGMIEIVLMLKKRELVVDIADSGTHFQKENVKEPDLENGQVRGYGMFLIEQLMDEIEYHSVEDGNRWRLIKRW